jgi:tetratricopeptide (TPR) repeat protein
VSSALVTIAALGVALSGPRPAGADSSGPSAAPATSATGAPTAERYYNEGLTYQKKSDFRRAVAAYERAVKMRDAYPEAWNGLGFSLRQQGKYDEAIKAYQKALTLKPDYSEAFEYLGEAYVKMGKLDEARAVLAKLEPLDRTEAAKLKAAIEAKKP